MCTVAATNKERMSKDGYVEDTKEGRFWGSFEAEQISTQAWGDVGMKEPRLSKDEAKNGKEWDKGSLL